MAHWIRNVLLGISMFAIASAAIAQQPPDVVKSDALRNTAMGTDVLLNITPTPNAASDNTGTGYRALNANTTGAQNTATGVAALLNNTTGYFNTATGSGALAFNTSGMRNTATGYAALSSNTTGEQNTAAGFNALFSNTTGFANTADGYSALGSNADGYNNVAIGFEALYGNTTGYNNTAIGPYALFNNTTGYGNAAQGMDALSANATGIRNTAFGNGALLYSTGSYNIALGWSSGYNLTTGSYNIDIGNLGVAGDNGTIRIGAAGKHTAAYIAGINSTQVTGAAVYVTAGGQLGVLPSSERYKTDVAAMGGSTQRLDQLRPVMFKLTTDPQGAVQYGLIAEEVDKVYPELVIRDAEGRIEGVRYEELPPMLLNELQQQRKQIAAQAQQLREMRQQLAELRELREQLTASMEHRSPDNVLPAKMTHQ